MMFAMLVQAVSAVAGDIIELLTYVKSIPRSEVLNATSREGEVRQTPDHLAHARCWARFTTPNMR